MCFLICGFDMFIKNYLIEILSKLLCVNTSGR